MNMIMKYEEPIKSDFKGTIIDIETIGEFNRSYGYDSRGYEKIIQVILGYINRDKLHIYCATNQSEILKLKRLTKETVDNLKKPFHAFNCEFETCVFFHHVGIEITFDRELNEKKYEKKGDIVRKLKIPNYDDPFFDDGLLCMRAWNKKEFDKAIAHNRACLLKERDILIKRGFREPDEILLIELE